MNIKFRLMALCQQVSRAAAQLRGLFPSRLPTGVTEFNAWADSIASTYRLPTADQDSVRFSLASQIMHLGPTADSKPKYYFVRAIRAGAAKQIAGNAFYEIKSKHQAAQKAAQAAEATAPSVANVPKGI